MQRYMGLVLGLSLIVVGLFVAYNGYAKIKG